MNVTFRKQTIFFFVVNLFSSFIAQAQTFTYVSNDNNSFAPEVWAASTTWTIVNPLNWSPATPGNPTHGNLAGAEIYGYTLSESDLTIADNAPIINIYDTLFIDGDFMVASNTQINVFGLLVVRGDLTLPEGAVQFFNQGKVVATGNLRVVDGSITNFEDSDFYVFGSTNVGSDTEPPNGGGNIDGCVFWNTSCDPEESTQTENDLQTNDPNLYAFVTSGGNIPLPITLLHFQAQPQSSASVLLSWATAEEENFDYFTVERSHNGVDFAEVGRVYGSGVNTKERRDYELIDTKPLTGTSYYRLKATDYDGTVEYFKPTYVNIEQQGFSANIYPNPGSGEQLTLQIGPHNPEAVGFEIYNLQGVLVHQQEVRFPTNTITFSKHLEKGMYVAVIRAGGESKTLKWMVE